MLHTFVATVEIDPTSLGADHVATELTQTLEANGCRFVSCGWAPDPDSIADGVMNPVDGSTPPDDFPDVAIHDLNP